MESVESAGAARGEAAAGQEPADPAEPRLVATQQDFGRALTAVRLAAGLTVRQVARTAELPASTVGDYFAGRHLPPPSQPDLLTRVLGVCGVSDPAALEEWLAALGRARRTPGRRAASTVAPYRGLESFQPEDAGWFFGREELTRLLVQRAAGAGAAGLPLGVVGPSGSGKSSLLRAGLIPALLAADAAGQPDSAGQDDAASRADTAGPAGVTGQPDGAGQDDAAGQSGAAGAAGRAAGPGRYALFTPGPHPAEALAAALAPGRLAAAESGPAGPDRPGPPVPRAVIVDQFEETFTACRDEDERRAFIAEVCSLARRTLVVLGLRADCYGPALRYPELAAALQDRQVVVGPMSHDQLRRAIVEPARRARMDVSEGLITLLMREMSPRPGGPAASHEPGALPLLSHALRASWERSRGAQLTVADYLASGGIQDAIARTAEEVYAGLSQSQREAARQLFLRLVRITDESTESRRRVPLGELLPPAGSASAAEVLWPFVDRRLITVTEDTAEISHEALLAAWPRLRDWIDSDRDGLRIRRRISDRARIWQEADRETAALPRGGQLAIIRDWAEDPVNRSSLDAHSREFVDVAAAHERRAAEAARRRSGRLRRLVAALTALVVVTVVLAGYAFDQRQNLKTARDVADSRALAFEADQLRGEDPSLAAQLSLAAYAVAATPAAAVSVLDSSAAPLAARLIDSPDVVEAVALSPDRQILAVAAADGTLRLWDVADPGRPVSLGGLLLGPSASELYAAAFSPDGDVLAAAGAAGVVRLWNVSDPLRPAPIGRLTGPPGARSRPRTVYSVAFSPDGDTLAAGDADDLVWRWDVTDPRQPRPLPSLTGPAGRAGDVQSVAFSPDGDTLAAGSADDRVWLWDLSGPGPGRTLGRPMTGPGSLVSSVAFSPDGDTLAAGSDDHKVWLWNVTRPARPVRLAPLTGAADWVNAVAFSPDGAVLAAASSDDTVRLWDTANRRLIGTLPHPDVVTSLAWADEHLLVSGVADGTVRAWRLPAPILAAAGSVNSVAFSPNGTRLAVGSTNLELWNPVTRTELGAVGAPPRDFVNAVGWDPVAPVVAAGYNNGSVRLWQVSGRRPAPLGPALRASASGFVEFVAFSRNGRLLASAGDDGTVHLWDVRDPAHPVPLAVLHDAPTIAFSVAFSPGGQTLAVASADNLTRLWDIADVRHPHRLRPSLGGTHSYDISVAFSPDGRTLAVGSADRTVRLWNVADPARPRLLGGPLAGPEGYIYSVAFSPDGRTLAAGSTDNTVWLWNVAHPGHPALIDQLTGPTGHVYSVAFSPDGGTLAAGSADGTVRLWDTSVAAAARAICAMAGQPLTRAEWQRYDEGRSYAPPCARS